MPNDSQKPIITPELYALAMRLSGIFMPYATEELENAYKSDPDQARRARFVHYTSADAAIKIIETKRIWMRNTNCMADYREVRHGFDMFRKFFAVREKYDLFVESVDVSAPGAAREAIERFDRSWNDIQSNTYITSVSRHEQSENRHGRLSMWRAFGGVGGARVGIVLALPYFTGATSELSIFFNPVEYLPDESASNVLDRVIENVRSNHEFLKTFDRAVVVDTIFLMFLTRVVCLKHEGFREEREWRAIYEPLYRPSPLIESSTMTIQGIPQIVHKIPLDSSKSASLVDLEFSRIFDRLIIGPTQYAEPMKQAFISALTKAGVTDAAPRVVVSGIPIRT